MAEASGKAGLDRWMRLDDGRRLAWREYGAPDGMPVIALHGTPGSRGKYAIADVAARELGLRLVCPDRWGYGLSERPSRIGLEHYARDVAALADHLGLAQFAVVGISGGGPYAAAVAALLDARVRALALVAPVGPIAGTPAAWRLRAFHQVCFRVLPVIPGAIRLAFGVFRGVLAVSPGAAVMIASARAGRIDREIVRRRAVRDSLGETFRLGLSRGSTGAVIDMALFSRAWGVALDAISARSRLWIGLEDKNVPVVAARRLAAAIPGCGLREIEAAGHFWITGHFGEVLEWLRTETAGSAEGATVGRYGAIAGQETPTAPSSSVRAPIESVGD